MGQDWFKQNGFTPIQPEAKQDDWFSQNGFTPIDAPKQLEPGNIDLRSRPHVKNDDGTISTVRSMSFEDEDGTEVLIPTVVGDRVVSDDDAIDHYRKTGEHLGKFSSPDAATEYASKLHDDYAAGKYDPSSWLRRAGDVGVSLMKGFGSIPEAVVGIADIPTLGHAGKFLKDKLGYDPQSDRAIWESMYTPEQKQAYENVRRAEGFLGTAGAIWDNPTTVGHSIVESLPAMLAGGAAGRAVGAAVPAVEAIAGGIGEGLVSAGSAAEQTRQESKTGTLSPKQSLAALASGVGTTAFGVLGNKAAHWLGIEDVDTLLTGAVSQAKQSNIAKKIIYGAFSEGVLEELPQSIQEQVWQNYAQDKPLTEGVDQAALLGMVAGAVMGAGANLLPQGQHQPTPAPAPTPPPMGANQPNPAPQPPITPVPPPVPPPVAPPQPQPGPPITPITPPVAPTPAPPTPEPIAPVAPTPEPEPEMDDDMREFLEELKRREAEEGQPPPETVPETVPPEETPEPDDISDDEIKAPKLIKESPADFEELLAAAREINPEVSEAGLKKVFDERVEMVRDAQPSAEDHIQSGRDPIDLAQTIARLGGIDERDTFAGNKYFNRPTGEITALKEEARSQGYGNSGAFGSMFGVKGVFRNGGLKPDVLIQSLHQFPRFQWIESPSDLQNFLVDASRRPKSGNKEIRLKDLGIDPEIPWWMPPPSRAGYRKPMVDRGGDISFDPEALDAPARQSGPPTIGKFVDGKWEYNDANGTPPIPKQEAGAATVEQVEGKGPWQEFHVKSGDRHVEVRGMDVGTPPRPARPEEDGLWFAYEERDGETYVVARGENKADAINLAQKYLRGEHAGEKIERPVVKGAKTGKPPIKSSKPVDVRLPGDVGKVRDTEVSTPKIPLPPQGLTLKGQDAPESMRPKPPSLFEQQGEAHQKVRDAMKELGKHISANLTKLNSGLPVDEKTALLTYKIVKALGEAGVVDAKVAWQYVQEEFAELAGDVRNAFNLAWQRRYGVDPKVESTYKPSMTLEERQARVAKYQATQKTREEQAAKDSKPAPKEPELINGLPAEQVTMLDEYGLVAGAPIRIPALQNNEYVPISGKTKEDTLERKDLFKANEGRWGQRFGLGERWLLPVRRLADFLRGLGALSKATGEAKRRLPAHLKDARLAKLRTDAERRPDRSGFDGTLREYVSDRTEEIIRRGEAAGIDKVVLDEQVEDIAILVRNFERGNKAGILASDPGTGKTFVLAGTIAELVKKGGVKTVVYVTKNNDLITQFKRDAKPFGIADKVQFMSYAKFRETPAPDTGVDMLVFDEAHEVKNVKEELASAQGLRGAEWIGKSKYTVLASATYAENPTQVKYLSPTGLFDEVFGGFPDFAATFGATPILINKEKGIYDYQWRRTSTSDADQKAAREWMRKEGFFTSRPMRLPKDKVDVRLVKIDGDSKIATLFNAVMDARKDAKLSGSAPMWLTNFAKRLLEASKVQTAINEAQSAIDRGRYPIIFIETKAEKIIDVPYLVQREREYNLAVAAAQRAGDEPPKRKEYGLPPKGIVQLLAKATQSTGESVIHIPPAEEMIADHFGQDDVAIYTGSVSNQKAQANLDDWRAAKKRVLVATMAKGGTGLSLHDKVGDHQTTQINVNLPWNATGVVQVAQRSARYGLQGKAEIMWLFAENIAMDKMLSRRVGGRMADMGALVHGQVAEGAERLQDWNFDDIVMSDDDVAESYSEDGDEAASYSETDEDGDDEPAQADEDDEPEPEKKSFYDEEPTPGDHPNEEGEHVYGLEIPEIVELAQELQGTPGVVARFRKLGQLGVFRGRRGIQVNAALFKEGRERELAQVLAHEIGHLIDWLPNETLKRGNLLGRLQSLDAFLKHTFVKPNGDVIELADIKAELTEVSDLWRPWDRSTASETFRKYRASGVELMADAMSALLTDPGFLQEHAPRFYAEFFEALYKKPDVSDEYFALQSIMQMTPEERTDRRLERDIERVKKGSAKAVGIEKDKVERIRRKRFEGWWLHLKSQMLDKHYPVIDRVKKLGIKLAEDLDPRYALQERNYIGGKIKGWVQRNVQPLVDRLNENDIDWNSFGLFLEYDRVIKGDRQEVANPGGENPKIAAEKRAALAKRYTPKQMEIIEDAIFKFRASIGEVVDAAFAAGIYSPEAYKKFKENPAYATFRVLDYLAENVTAKVYHQVGTLKDVANVADSTILKMMVTLREIQNQKAKRTTFDLLLKHYKGDIEVGRRVGKGVFAPPKNKDLREVGYWKAGVWQKMFVDPLIADSLNNESIGKNLAVIKIINSINSKIFRPLFTGINPGFQSFNLLRDFFRTWKNVPNMSLVTAMKRYYEAVPLARVRAFGLPDKPTAAHRKAWSDLIAAEEGSILSITFNDFNSGRTVGDTEIEDILLRSGAKKAEGPPRTGWKTPLKVTDPIIEFIKDVGDFIETLPKAAGMYQIAGDRHISELTPAERSFIRTKVGSPDYLAGGTLKPITNEVFLFSNAIAQAWRADYEAATDPKTRSGWMWKTAAVNVLPKMIMLAGLTGLLDKLFGETYRQVLERVSEYDKTNYTIIPFGLDAKGNAVYLRLPQDDTGRFIGGLMWKALRLGKGDKDVVDTLSQVMSYSAGQFPSVTPVVGAAADVVSMVSGQNPYDDFRSRNLFTDDEMAAGGPQKWKKFIGWEFQQLGGSIVMKFVPGETRPQEQTAGQKMLELPVVSNILGRWIRVSDFGQHETLRDIKNDAKRDEARHRLQEKTELNDAIRDYMKTPPWERQDNRGQGKRYGLAREIVRKVYGDRDKDEQSRRTHQIQKKIMLGAVRGQADPLVEEVMSAQTNQQKRELIEAAKKSMSPQEFSGWLDRAASSEIISRPLSQEFKRSSPR